MPDNISRIYTDIWRTMNQKESLILDSMESARMALVVVDMVNGFTSEGALQSDRIQKLIPGIAVLMEKCRDRNIPIIAFADSHPDNSPEFTAYPVHCQAGSSESQIVSELAAVGGYINIPKNSTNGFLEASFQIWLKENPKVNSYIVVGDCTDICVEQFCNTLKAYFNMKNLISRVIVPLNSVDTFDADFHPGDFYNYVALQIMAANGVEIVKAVV